MLRLIILLPVFLLAMGLRAQTLNIDNFSNCEVQVTVSCGHPTPPVCQYCTVTVCIPAGGLGVTVNPCFSDCSEWTMATVCAVDPTCPNICNPVATHCTAVSWNGCGGLPPTASFNALFSCTPCAGLTVNVDASVPNQLTIN